MRVLGQRGAGLLCAADVVRALALGAAALVGGCTALQDAAGIPRSGHQPDGTYVVSAEEEKLACRQIKQRIETLSGRIQALPVQAALEEEAAPRTVGSALGRMFGGPGAGLKATTDFQKATAESEALNALLARKQCV